MNPNKPFIAVYYPIIKNILALIGLLVFINFLYVAVFK